MNEIADQVVTDGIRQYEKFKAAAQEAISRARTAEENAAFFKGQCETLQAQKAVDDARHRADLLRIAELEAFVASLTELYNGAAEKLRLGGFRRATSTSAPNFQQLETELSQAIKERNVEHRAFGQPEPTPPLVLTDHMR